MVNRKVLHRRDREVPEGADRVEAVVALAVGVEERRTDRVLDHGVLGPQREPLVLLLAGDEVVGALREAAYGMLAVRRFPGDELGLDHRRTITCSSFLDYRAATAPASACFSRRFHFRRFRSSRSRSLSSEATRVLSREFSASASARASTAAPSWSFAVGSGCAAPWSTSVERSPRRSWARERVGPSVDQGQQCRGRDHRHRRLLAVNAGQQLDRARDERRLELSVHPAQHGDTGRVGVRRHDGRVHRRQAGDVQELPPVLAHVGRGHHVQPLGSEGPSPPAQECLQVVPGPEPLGLFVLGGWCRRLGQHPGGVLLPPGGPAGTQLGEPASVELLGEGVGRDDEVHLDPDERVQGQPDLVLVGDAEVRRGQQRDPLVPPHPVADARPAPLDLAPGEPGRLVGAEQLVGGQPGLVRRGGHLHPRGLEGLAVGGQVGGDHGPGRVRDPDVPDQLSSSTCHRR